MTDGTIGGTLQALEKAVGDLRASMAPDDGGSSDPLGPLLVPAARYAQISKDLDTALGQQEAGDTEGALALLVRAAKAIGQEYGLQAAEFDVSEEEVLRRVSARHGSTGGSGKGTSFERRRQQVIAELAHKATWSPWRNITELEHEIVRLADEAFGSIKYGRRQIDLILAVPEVRAIRDSLKRQMRRRR